MWWNPELSWVNKYIDGDTEKGRKDWPPVQFSDAWHLFKMLMVVFVCISICTFRMEKEFDVLWLNIVTVVGYVIIYGITWNWTFKLCYSWLFVKK